MTPADTPDIVEEARALHHRRWLAIHPEVLDPRGHPDDELLYIDPMRLAEALRAAQSPQARDEGLRMRRGGDATRPAAARSPARRRSAFLRRAQHCG